MGVAKARDFSGSSFQQGLQCIGVFVGVPFFWITTTERSK